MDEHPGQGEPPRFTTKRTTKFTHAMRMSRDGQRSLGFTAVCRSVMGRAILFDSAAEREQHITRHPGTQFDPNDSRSCPTCVAHVKTLVPA